MYLTIVLYLQCDYLVVDTIQGWSVGLVCSTYLTIVLYLECRCLVYALLEMGDRGLRAASRTGLWGGCRAERGTRAPDQVDTDWTRRSIQ